MARPSLPFRWPVLAAIIAACACGPSFAQNRSAPPADSQAALAQLADQVSRLDPKAPNYGVRVKAILEELVRVNQSLARENAALKAQQAASPASTTTRAKKRRAPAAASGGNAAPAAGAATAESGPLFGRRGLTTYHRAGCAFGERIAKENRVYFATPTAAEAAGYHACRSCHPERAAPAQPPVAPKPPP